MEFYDSAQQRSPLLEELRALYHYRDLLVQLIGRTLKTRYKRSVLGIVWTLLNPLLTMIVLTLVFSSMFRFQIERYPVYILSGLLAWQFFSSATHSAMGEIIWSGALLQRIYVPKSVFPIAATGAGLVNWLIALIPLLVIAVVLGTRLTPAILVLPLAIVLLAAFALGIGLFLATAAVYFADMVPVYEVLLTIWMYATPIIYPVEMLPERWLWLFKLNPLYHLVRLFRAPLFEGVVPGWESWLYGGLAALVALVIGSLVFTAKSKEYAYRV